MSCRTAAALLAAACAALMTGCIGSAPIEGMKSPVFACYRAPLNTDLKDIDLRNLKTGAATHKCYVFGLFSDGDMSVAAAARAGGITQVKHVEYEYKNIFFFAYQEMTTIVYGDSAP